MKRFIIFFTIAFLGWANSSSAQLRFHAESSGNSAADVGISLATSAWSAEFRDDIDINLVFAFEDLDDDVLSSTQSVNQLATYVDFWNAIGDDVRSADDMTMFNGLPTGTTFSVYINNTSDAGGLKHQVPYVDNDQGANNSSVLLTTANAKALGLRGNDNLIDATIIFSNKFTWDYDPSDGISAGSLDFVGVAMHEIGHAMGFESGVDVLDNANIENLDGEVFELYGDDDDFEFVSSIDFLRFSDDSESFGADIDWTADDREKYYSIDGGLTRGLSGDSHWSTGVYHGDGEQASHWKRGLDIGIMNPNSFAGFANLISAADLQAFDVIGYDRQRLVAIPEPAGLVGLLWLAFALRRRRHRNFERVV